MDDRSRMIGDLITDTAADTETAIEEIILNRSQVMITKMIISMYGDDPIQGDQAPSRIRVPVS